MARTKNLEQFKLTFPFTKGIDVKSATPCTKNPRQRKSTPARTFFFRHPNTVFKPHQRIFVLGLVYPPAYDMLPKRPILSPFNVPPLLYVRVPVNKGIVALPSKQGALVLSIPALRLAGVGVTGPLRQYM